MSLLLMLILFLPGSVRAADAHPDAITADTTTISLVNYFFKVPITDANPKLVAPFLAVKAETLPKKMRGKAAAKQIEISTLIKLHNTKKQGSLIQPAEGCSEKDFVLPLKQADLYLSMNYEEVNEDEEKFVEDQTKCSEIDLGCRFSLKIFYERKKPRRLMFYSNDPIMAIVAASRGKSGTGTHFFGAVLTCMH